MSSNQIAPQETRRVIFSQATRVGDEVLGTDKRTGQGFILVGAPGNTVIRILINGIGDNVFDIILKRDGKEVRRWPSSLLSPLLPGPVWPGFPLPVRPGQIQFYAEQEGGTAIPISIDVIWANSLITVTS